MPHERLQRDFYLTTSGRDRPQHVSDYGSLLIIRDPDDGHMVVLTEYNIKELYEHVYGTQPEAAGTAWGAERQEQRANVVTVHNGQTWEQAHIDMGDWLR